jgi:hypothetical protein
MAALVLVLLTYNPGGQSAYHWVTSAIGASTFGPLHLLLVGVLMAGWAVFWIATWRALGTLGVTLAVLILGAIITWIALVCLAAVLAVGVSWSHFWRRITGQFNVEDVDD